MVAERENIQVTEEKELLQQRTQGSRNEMEIVFDAVSCNESFARVAVAAFITHLNPTLEELADIKTAVVGTYLVTFNDSTLAYSIAAQ